ncbi:ATP-binding protein [Acinetobacter johnsonii]|uniref:ATP-binding protein n=1 Tax=Acinetobacter johnsonii TaxID=40214 RepID=A0AA42SRE1_ACIJO|nr:AAA family ATPase [Acinetobacter johnsonii]MDH0968361.1 ATP-binding protein [Acinetobacter johnsonii]
MTEKLYYWAENLDGYSSDNEQDQDQTIEIKRLNFFIGKNNAGKSRFLRSLFLNNYPSNFYNNLTLRKNIKSLKENIFQIESFSYSTTKSDLQRYIKELFRDLNHNNTDQLTFLNSSINQILNRDSKISSLFPDFQQTELTKENVTQLDQLFIKKFHIPILRGMRPVTELANKQPYIERAQKDYFSDKEKYNSSNIITGESLYHELKEHLLGEPEQREIIRKYEEKLSQYFFDNETITLIPKHDQDVVNIKIGSDKQFPISELGDGLQQVIILTYEAFIKKDETHAFFIEEPELHMHAGMVRQLMNFYLNETNHYYFFTTHSNHLLDMADESDQVIIQKFVKQPKENPRDGFDFKIYRCDRDRDLLASLGVKPSSVYLANCTIWVEGITDRLYITKYMDKYLAELETTDAEQYKKYRRFMPNYHYTFVEYAGSNLTHWSFSDDYADHLDDKGLSAKAVASEMLLIADGDIKNKPERVKALQTEFKKENYFILKCKETENTLPKDSIINVAKSKFSRLRAETKKSYDILLIDEITDENYFDHSEFGIGKLLDQAIKKPTSTTTRTAFADGQGVGTIKYKLDFCREIIKDFDDHPNWQLTPKAKELCERIFQHIEKCNR